LRLLLFRLFFDVRPVESFGSLELIELGLQSRLSPRSSSLGKVDFAYKVYCGASIYASAILDDVLYRHAGEAAAEQGRRTE